jgi:hypothetical protein
MTNDPKDERIHIAFRNDPDYPDIDKIKRRLQAETEKSDEDCYPDERTKGIVDSPILDPKVHPHVYCLKHGIISINAGKLDQLNEPENLKKLCAAKDYAGSDQKHADFVLSVWNEFVQRLKEHTADNHWSQMLCHDVGGSHRFI